jgi:ABC-2 type transport system ATP-binding protein
MVRDFEYALQADGVTKTFGQRTVVDDVSFSVGPGEIFGFLGPNGSGKTTTIRMALGLLRPDAGTVSVLGSPPELSVLKDVGYLPEEAGLPAKAGVMETIRYLGRLKGLSRAEAESRGLELLSRVGLENHRLSKVEALSQGMRQMIQFVVTIIHRPSLLILDEPFAGLDPLNVQLMKQILLDHQRQGATVVFSTHIMADVEEMCERIVLITDGRLLLFGDLGDIKRARGVSSVLVQADGIPDELRGYPHKLLPDDTVEYQIGDGRTPDQVFQAYAASGIAVHRFERQLPSLNDIFIEEVSRARQIS